MARGFVASIGRPSFCKATLADRRHIDPSERPSQSYCGTSENQSVLLRKPGQSVFRESRICNGFGGSVLLWPDMTHATGFNLPFSS